MNKKVMCWKRLIIGILVITMLASVMPNLVFASEIASVELNNIDGESVDLQDSEQNIINDQNAFEYEADSEQKNAQIDVDSIVDGEISSEINLSGEEADVEIDENANIEVFEEGIEEITQETLEEALGALGNTKGQCGDNLSYEISYNNSNGYILKITGTGDMWDFADNKSVDNGYYNDGI